MNLKKAKTLRKLAMERYGPRQWKAAYKFAKKAIKREASKRQK